MVRTMTIACMALALFSIRTAFGAEVTPYLDYQAWSADVGGHEFVDFTEGQDSTPIGDFYADLGLVTFQADDLFAGSVFGDTDGGGAFGGLSDISINITLEEPITAFAVDYPGGIVAWFYRDGELVGESGLYGDDFTGWTLDTPFDAIQFGSPGAVYIDNIYFPTIVPAPAGLAVFAGLLVTRRRRRT